MLERAELISDSWGEEIVLKKDTVIPSFPTSLDCVTEPPPAPAREVNWENCNISFMEFYSDNLQNANMRHVTAQNTVFVDVDLTELNGYNADFRFSEFNDTVLDKINLVNAKIGGTIFENSRLSDSNLNYVKCNEHISGTVSSYYPCIFHQTELNDISAEHTIFENIHFMNSELRDTYIYNSEITTAKIIDSTLHNVEIAGNLFEIIITNPIFSEHFTLGGDVNVLRISNANYEDSSDFSLLDDIDVNIIQINNSRFDEFDGYGIIDSIRINDSTFSVFTSGDIDETNIINSIFEYLNLYVRNVSLRDSSMDELDIILFSDGTLELIGIQAKDGSVYGFSDELRLNTVSSIAINNSELEGLGFEELNTNDARINIRNSTFNNSFFNIDLSNARIVDSEFVDVEFFDIDMSHAQITNSVLIDTVFENVDLSRANLSGTEIIGGTFTGVITGDRSLGCTGHPICD